MNKLATNGDDVHFFTHSLAHFAISDRDTISHRTAKAFVHLAFVVASGSLDVRHLGRIAIVLSSRRYFVHLWRPLPLAHRYSVLCCAVLLLLHCIANDNSEQCVNGILTRDYINIHTSIRCAKLTATATPKEENHAKCSRRSKPMREWQLHARLNRN